MSVELKIKLKSLAEEQRIIRKEELSIKNGKFSYKSNQRRESIYLHRVMHVRPIIRATHIAYGLIRGLQYHEIENSPKSIPNWNKVKEMIKKYSTNNDDKLKNLEKIEELKKCSVLKAA